MKIKKIKMICPKATECTIDCDHSAPHSFTELCTQAGRCGCFCIKIKSRRGNVREK